MFSLLSRALGAMLLGIGVVIAGIWTAAETYPLQFWLLAPPLFAYGAWRVVLERRAHLARLTTDHVPSMSPIEYELYIARLLLNAGWSARHVGSLGDQGVDVIAELRGTRVAVQAKKYSRPVGNSAVQEVVAGKRYHSCALAVVVAPNSYTRAAKDLAHANGVLLLCHDDLHRLERLARVP
jgi:HJR/Mrr/RecB family endonuclease